MRILFVAFILSALSCTYVPPYTGQQWSQGTTYNPAPQNTNPQAPPNNNQNQQAQNQAQGPQIQYPNANSSQATGTRVNPLPYDLVPDLLTVLTCPRQNNSIPHLSLGSYSEGLKLSEEFKVRIGTTRGRRFMTFSATA